MICCKLSIKRKKIAAETFSENVAVSSMLESLGFAKESIGFRISPDDGGEIDKSATIGTTVYEYERAKLPG